MHVLPEGSGSFRQSLGKSYPLGLNLHGVPHSCRVSSLGTYSPPLQPYPVVCSASVELLPGTAGSGPSCLLAEALCRQVQVSPPWWVPFFS